MIELLFVFGDMLITGSSYHALYPTLRPLRRMRRRCWKIAFLAPSLWFATQGAVKQGFCLQKSIHRLHTIHWQKCAKEEGMGHHLLMCRIMLLQVSDNVWGCSDVDLLLY